MNKKKMEFQLDKEFISIQNQLTSNLEILCADLHAIRLSLINMPKLKEISIPNPYITYFLKEDINSFINHAKGNIDQILVRINNNYALNIINIFELKIKEAYGLLLALRKQKSLSLSGKSLQEFYLGEINKYKTLGVLVNEIIEKINSIDKNIIKDEDQYYNYFKNYILLRNCLSHKNGLVTNNEIDLEIRLPIITQAQIDDAIKKGNINKINPKTLIKRWQLNEHIQLKLNEVEGIAYGLMKVSNVIIKHMYKATDKHFAGLEKAGK